MRWDKLYDDMLDEIYPTVKLGELEYSPSMVLREVDPTAYRCGFNDWTGTQYFPCAECGEAISCPDVSMDDDADDLLCETCKAV